MADEYNLKDLQKYAWDYFQLHAQQRMTAFNFFIILSALLTTGLVNTFQPTYTAHFLGMFLGLLMALVSLVFWKLDQRIKYFIKNAENALKYIESKFPIPLLASDPHQVQLFSYEEVSTQTLRDRRAKWFWNRHLSYAQSFNLVFIVFALFGVIGFVVSLLKAIKNA